MNHFLKCILWSRSNTSDIKVILEVEKAKSSRLHPFPGFPQRHNNTTQITPESTKLRHKCHLANVTTRFPHFHRQYPQIPARLVSGPQLDRVQAAALRQLTQKRETCVQVRPRKILTLSPHSTGAQHTAIPHAGHTDNTHIQAKSAVSSCSGCCFLRGEFISIPRRWCTL